MAYEKRIKALLGKGYFPKELPRAFTTADFGQYSLDILKEWKASGVFTKKVAGSKVAGKTKANAYNYSLNECAVEVISAPKKGHERRDIHVTHPVPQAILAHEISENWSKLLKYLPQDSRSVDRLEISESEPRGLSEIDFGIHRRKKAYIEAQSDWIVRSDITRYYPSIYTHSLSWACYGKEAVKRQRKKYEGSLADRLDQLVRLANRNQTVGIPIGPETSRILAELIGRHVDREVCSVSPEVSPASVDRLQDDWFVGTTNRETAELALSAISKAYRAYGLEINGSKTSLKQVGEHIDDGELSEIRAFLASVRFSLTGYRLQEFLSLVERMHVRNSRSSAINYALSVLEERSFTREDVEEIESFLIKAAAISPSSMQRICNLLLNLNYRSKFVSHRRISRRVRELAERSARLGHTYELIWLIWTLRGLRSKFASKVIAEYSEAYSLPCLSLVLMDMREQKIFLSTLPEDKWLQVLTDAQCRGDPRWLIAYEGFRHGWLKDTKGLMKKPFFSPMSKRNVVFYNPRRNVASSQRNVRRRIDGARKSSMAFTRFLLRSGFLDERY